MNKQDKIFIPKVVQVRALAEEMSLSPSKVIKTLMENGVMASVNESVDFETASIIADELGFRAILLKANAKTPEKKSVKNLVTRAPVVSVMGHVDHGKTTLLDKIRSTDIAEGEAGKITQHLSAYQIRQNKKLITFLDTPGHEAFASLRAHGASVTDIVVLVIAADDGIKPQTKEVISHAKAGEVPIIVAINKIDSPKAQIEKVKQELAKHDLNPEQWGGDTPVVEISAKTGKNIDKLLKTILIVADMLDLKAESKGRAQGVVIESHIEPGLGPVATVLVNRGILRVGDFVAIGKAWGKVRSIFNDRREKISHAIASQPVQINGLRGLPSFASYLEVFPSQKEAKAKASNFHQVSTNIKSVKDSNSVKANKSSIKQLNIILKADVVGSLEAIRQQIQDMPSAPDIKINIVSASVGAISESDINLASSLDGAVIAFQSYLSKPVEKLAKEKNILIGKYDVIYELIDDIYKMAENLLEPEIKIVKVAQIKVKKVFSQNKKTALLGGKCSGGEITTKLNGTVSRKGKIVGKFKPISLHIGADNVNKVNANQLCGVKLEKIASSYTIEVGDKLIFSKQEKNVRVLKK